MLLFFRLLSLSLSPDLKNPMLLEIGKKEQKRKTKGLNRLREKHREKKRNMELIASCY